VYLWLRVGDLGLLVAILLLMVAGDTLQIEAALHAGEGLDAARRAWVVGGLLLAVGIKTGSWPLHGWLRAGLELPTPARAWLYGTLMPNLGLYLLARTTPLLVLSPALRWISVGIASVGALLMGLQRRDRLPGALKANVLLSSAGLLLAAGDAKSALVGLLVAATPLRLWLWRAAHAPAQTGAPTEAGIVRVAHAMRQAVEVNLLEDGITGLTRPLVGGARFLHRTVEQAGLEGALRAAAQVARQAGYGMQWLHTGKLRMNLMWAALGLGIVLGVTLL
jgi:hypothetical protein